MSGHNDVTVTELEEAKAEAEREILRAIRDSVRQFSEQTGVPVADVTVATVDTRSHGGPRSFQVANVSLDLNLDGG
jgi:hypothetical protein